MVSVSNGMLQSARKDREKKCSRLREEGFVWSLCGLEFPKCHVLSQEGLIGGHSKQKSVLLAAQEVLNSSGIVQLIKNSPGRPVFCLMFLLT